jgi:hypothetical protein
MQRVSCTQRQRFRIQSLQLAQVQINPTRNLASVCLYSRLLDDTSLLETVCSIPQPVDNMPGCIWIWDMTTTHLVSLIVQREGTAIKQIVWHPLDDEVFCFICGGDDSSGVGVGDADARVYFWERGSVRGVDLPEGMRGVRCEWRGDGEALCVLDRDKLVVWWRL